MPAENLTGDASLDWAARAIPVLLEASLEPVPGMQVLRLGRYQDSAGPAATLHCRYERADGGLRVSCWRESSPETWEASGPAPGGGGTSSLAAITAALTQRIHPQARAARPLSDAALESFAKGQYLEAAEQSPAFSAAYTDGVAALIGQGSMDAARKLLDLGERNATQLPPLTNARLDLARSTVSGDATAQIAALEKLDALSSPDPRRLAQLAQLLLSRRRIPDAVAAQQRLTALTPQDASAWNQLGYIRAAAGDLRGAKTALAEYRRIAPATPNALDSLGEVHYQAGEFAAAEKYFREAHAQDPAFNGGQAAIKAAFAQRLKGDLAGAEASIAAIAKDRPNGTLLLAQWRCSFGDAAGAAASLEKSLPSLARDAQPAAAVQLALWRVREGKSAAAQGLLRQAMAASPPGPLRANAFFVAFLSQPPVAAGEWRQRALKAIPGPQLEELRVILVSLALLSQEKRVEAIPALESILKQTSPLNDSRVRVLLAAALTQASRSTEAIPLLKRHTVPVLTAVDAFGSTLLNIETKLRQTVKME